MIKIFSLEIILFEIIGAILKNINKETFQFNVKSKNKKKFFQFV